MNKEIEDKKDSFKKNMAENGKKKRSPKSGKDLPIFAETQKLVSLLDRTVESIPKIFKETWGKTILDSSHRMLILVSLIDGCYEKEKVVYQSEYMEHLSAVTISVRNLYSSLHLITPSLYSEISDWEYKCQNSIFAWREYYIKKYKLDRRKLSSGYDVLEKNKIDNSIRNLYLDVFIALISSLSIPDKDKKSLKEEALSIKEEIKKEEEDRDNYNKYNKNDRDKL